VGGNDRIGRLTHLAWAWESPVRGQLARRVRRRGPGKRTVRKGRHRAPARPYHYLLEDQFECWLLNAKHVKNVPGRPKTDKLDVIWLADVAATA
jgi:hypothetical protein